MKISIIQGLAWALAALSTIAVPTVSLANNESCQGEGRFSNLCHKVMSCGRKSPVYLCNSQKLYFNKKTAKKMNFKDPEGKSLIKVKSIPAGFQNGSSMTQQSDH